MSDDIGGPGGADFDAFRAAENEGRIVLFCGHTKADVETEYGVSTVADVSLIISLNDDYKGFNQHEGWVFGAALAPAIYRADTPVVVGRVAKKPTKNGREAWVLEELADGELAAVRAWYTENIVHADGQFALKAEAPF